MPNIDLAAVASRVREAAAAKGFSIRALEAAAGLPKDRLTSLLALHRPRAETVEAVAPILGVTREWLLWGAEEKEPDFFLRESGTLYVPVLAEASAAGHSRIVHTPEAAMSKVKIPRDLHFIRVEGDSMIPVALPGQYLQCTAEKPDSGDLAVVELADDDELYFKRVYFSKERVDMVSANPDPKYAPRSVSRRAIRSMHKVWGIKF
jgi:phage repressor protein C with HTH and peptisase S24 domain